MEDNNNGTVFHEAILTNDIKKLNILLNNGKGIDINQIIRNKSTALHLAVGVSNEKIVKMLLEKGANVKLKDKNGENPLHIAARIGNESLVKLLLDISRINVNIIAKGKYTALHIAVKHNQIIIVKLLLKYNAKVNTQCSEGDSPLHEAVRNENIELVKLLLDHGADLNCTNNARTSVFHDCFEHHNEDLIKLFLSHDVNVRQKNCNGQNSLHLASRYSTKKIVELLLKLNLNVNEPNSNGSVPLHFAVINSNSDEIGLSIVRLLIKSGADVDAADIDGRTALLIAAARQKLKVCKYLLGVGANINHVTKRHSTPLLAAFEIGNVQIIRYLLEQGAEPNCNNTYHCSPLHIIISSSNDSETIYNIVLLLLAKGIKIDGRNGDNSTALHLALEKHDMKLFNLLIAQGACIHVRNHYHRSPLYVAVTENLLSAVEILLEKGANANDCQKIGKSKRSLLAEAVNQNNEMMIKLLLKYNANVKDKETVILAAERGNVNVMKILMAEGADIHILNERRLSTLNIAILHQNHAMVQFLLDNGTITDEQKTQPLSHAFLAFNTFRNTASKSIMDLLIKHIALLNSQNLHFNEMNMKLIRDKKIMSDKYQIYCQELADMKTTKVCADSPVTYFDLLVKRHNALVHCLRYTNVRSALALGDYKLRFLKYSLRVEVNCHYGLKRLQMMNKFQSSLNEIFSLQLPYDVICKICEYLSNDDFHKHFREQH